MAPADSDTDERAARVAIWTDRQLEDIYHRKDLHQFLTDNRVMTILKLQMISKLKGPVTEPPATANKLDAVKALLGLLQEAGITAGAFKASDLFDVDFESLQSALSTLFEKIKVLVGEVQIKSELCIFVYVEKQSKVSEREGLIDNTYELHGKRTAVMANLGMDVIMSLDLLPGESRGYWKYHAPGKWFKQAKAMGKMGKIDNEKADLLFDSGAEVSILDAAFARKVGCYIDESQKQECVGSGENVYVTEGRSKIKVTLAGSLVYFFDVWVGEMSGQDAILGMDFMVPAGIRLDLANGTSACRMRFASNCREDDRLTHGWECGCREIAYLDCRHVSVGSRRYNEWQNLAYQATTDELDLSDQDAEEPSGPMVERPSYDPPKSLLRRSPAAVTAVAVAAEKIVDNDETEANVMRHRI
ncbi:unnamed protein product [Phytophthora lilii]|uniref:Unnamed protein product n=1 Tax=Phytophthora lilii TaxID=2077276 RepID=A0A9W6WVZ5_9STRA|nr:unnamed protein product [Phytophthora lilii]